jgi:Cdc6-like AAA superfamily ATPase
VGPRSRHDHRRPAASAADRAGTDVISDAQLLDAAGVARAQLTQASLESLTPHQRTVYGIIAEEGPLSPGGIYDRYTEAVEQPRTKRTVRSYLSKMTQYNLLESRGSSRDRTYLAIEVASPA